MGSIAFYSRDDQYGFLSNFWRAFEEVDGVLYPTNEHFYQSQKASREDTRDWIRSAPNPFLAMKAGRSLRPEKELRPDWEGVKLGVMRVGLMAKFSQNEVLRARLLETGDAVLLEDSPTDRYWGGRLDGSQNWLGRLLMETRAKLAADR